MVIHLCIFIFGVFTNHRDHDFFIRTPIHRIHHIKCITGNMELEGDDFLVFTCINSSLLHPFCAPVPDFHIVLQKNTLLTSTLFNFFLLRKRPTKRTKRSFSTRTTPSKSCHSIRFDILLFSESSNRIPLAFSICFFSGNINFKTTKKLMISTSLPIPQTDPQLFQTTRFVNWHFAIKKIKEESFTKLRSFRIFLHFCLVREITK
mmetsp:Transcript_9932/g.13389  ORF Transcript_9932/g.13389 Transcript_9932/m.13389 type:complete len:205 (-) Transcript_9932:4145-4759(-)